MTVSSKMTVQCPSCGARLSNGAQFQVVIPYKAASTNEVIGLDETGGLILGQGDPGNPTWFGKPELVCESCGHQWTTKRDWT